MEVMLRTVRNRSSLTEKKVNRTTNTPSSRTVWLPIWIFLSDVVIHFIDVEGFEFVSIFMPFVMGSFCLD